VTLSKNLAWATAGLVLCIGQLQLSGADPTAEVRTDTHLRAMVDELGRSKTLQLNNLDKPYFIEYTTSDSDQMQVTASLGGITSSARIHVRQPRLQVRVGDYKFDNTNSVFSGNASLGLFPIDDDYQAIRTALWLSTDGLYKAAADQITRKRNAVLEAAAPEITPDLAPAKPVQLIQPLATLKIDQARWEDVQRRLSGRFATHPDVTNSVIRVRAISSMYRLVNNEGTIIRIPQEMSDIEIRSAALAPDGSRVWNHQFITVLHPAQFPNEEQLAKMVDTVANETEALAKASHADDYSGPVLFEQEAAAEMMAQVLTDAARLPRKPLAPPGANNPGLQILESVWVLRLNSTVAPEWLSVVDDPRQHQFHGTTLVGQYDADDEGVPAERVTLVDKGILKGFLSSREPVHELNASNGHGRLPGPFGSEEAVIGNLFVQADHPLREAELRAKLLEKIKSAGLKYGIIIRRLDFPSTANFEQLQSLGRQLQKNGYARTLTPPLLAFRLYPDGHEELVRGVRFREFSARDLRDLDAASDRPYVLNYVTNGTSFNLADSGSDATTSSVVCPSLLFDSLDLARAEEEPGKLPIVPPPALTAQ
jgi:TldD protein